MDATPAVAVGATVCAAENDTAAANADDGSAAANATSGTVRRAARTTANEHDDSSTTVWHAESVRANLLTGRGGFQQE